MKQVLTTSPHTSIPQIEIGGKQYAAPFRHLFRPHTTEELEELRKSGEVSGGWTADPVTTYESETYGPAVIDGHTRATLSQETGLPVAVVNLGHITDEQAEHLATVLNSARRHLTLAEQSEARKARIERVKAARKSGESLRSIAAKEKVSPQQIRNDLRDAEEPEPATIKGRDGKTYSVPEALKEIRKALVAAPAVEPEPEPVIDQEAPVAFPRTHPHADIAARLDGLIRSVAAITDYPMSRVLSLLRQSRNALYGATA